MSICPYSSAPSPSPLPSPAAAFAFYDPRLGAVVVATHSQQWQVGLVVDVTPPVEK